MTEPVNRVGRLRGSLPAIAISLLVGFALGGLLLGRGERQSPSDVGASEPSEPPAATEWTCSMHPQVRAPEAGACPICGMDLIPATTEESGDHEHADRISLTESARVRARIRTAPVKRLHTGRIERRLLGRVDYDETRLRTVTSWIGGRIDRLRVRTTGQRVKRGQVVAALYSPEVFSAHQDLLVAREQITRLQGATEMARVGAEATLQAARDRLRLLGVPASELATMEKASRPSEQVRIRSPFAGTVIERLATEGNYVKTGTGLYQIADLSRLWVQLDAYESDLPLLELGQEVSLEVQALPAQTFEGRVTFVAPVLDQRTRTTRVRIEVDNAAGRLRPGMFAEAVVRSDPDQTRDGSLVIPHTAPLFTGRRSLVYVEVPDANRPTYEPRVVRLGPRLGDDYPVVAGLRAGERVVIHGAFTLDADLQIRGGRSMMSLPDDSADQPGSRIVEVPPVHRDALAGVVARYLELHQALAADALADACAAAGTLVRAANAIDPASSAPFRQAWLPVQRQLVEHAEHLAGADNLDSARVAFRDLSQQIATILRVFGNPTNHTVRLAFCPMALAGEGGEWVQRASTIQNPYFGATMHSCGEVHEVVEHGTYLPLRDEPGSTGSTDSKGGAAHSEDHRH